MPPEESRHSFLEPSEVDATVFSENGPRAAASELTFAATEELPATTFRERIWLVVDRRLLQGFTPVYFVSIMGTGITSVALYDYPYPALWLKVCGCIMWAIAIFFFLSTTVLFVVSLIYYPSHWSRVHRDPDVAPFMGCYAMGYTTLINFLYGLVGTRHNWIIALWVLWWISVALSVYTACITFYMAFLAKKNGAKNKLSPSRLNMTILMPVVTLTVAASSGGKITPLLTRIGHKIVTLVVSYIMWLVAVCLAFVIIAVNFWKLFVHKVPDTKLMFTTFLPVGLLGQAAYGILLFGDNIYQLLSDHTDTIASSGYLTYMGPNPPVDNKTLVAILGNIAVWACGLVSLNLVSFGYFMTFIAVTTCVTKSKPFTTNYNRQFSYNPHEKSHWLKQQLRGTVRFSKAFWAMTFPLGTMGLGNMELYRVFNRLGVFRVLAATYFAALILVTLGCLVGFIYALVLECVYIIRGPKPEKELV